MYVLFTLYDYTIFSYKIFAVVNAKKMHARLENG